MTVLPMSCPKIHERNDQAQMLESISLAADPVMILQCRSSGRHGPKGRGSWLLLETHGGDQHDKKEELIKVQNAIWKGLGCKDRFSRGCDPQSEQQTRVLTGARSRGRPPTTRGVDDEVA
jgi:hypothetical protein